MNAQTRALVAAVVASWSAAGPAVAEELPMHPGRLAHALDRAAHTGRVLYVAAHPDDENTRLLAYLANARHLTVAYLSLTRGEGGQNLIGSEQGPLLGVIRTQELLSARALDGAQQRFTRARDFGFSKRADEALERWGHEQALADVVWVYRSFQPDVVITRFDETPPNHGHHTASALLAREAFEAAGDPKRFPEQLERGVTPWKPLRLVHNVSPWRGKPPAEALPLDVGGYDVRLGLSYGELAARSRTQHKSQGFGAAGERGSLLEHFTHVAGRPAQKDLLEGVKVDWTRYGPPAAPLVQAFTEARATLFRDEPEAALPALGRALEALRALPEGPRRASAQDALEGLMAEVAGLFARATTEVPAVAPGAKVPVKVELVLRRPAKVRLERLGSAYASALAVATALKPHEKLELPFELPVPADTPVSVPYWLRAEQPDPAQVARAEDAPPLTVRVALSFAGQPVSLDLPVQQVWTDPVLGERARTVRVVAPVTVTPVREAVMLPNGGLGQVVLSVRGWQVGVKPTVRLPLPKGWRAQPAEATPTLSQPGDVATVRFEVRAPKGAAAIEVAPEAEVAGTRWAFREDAVDHRHLPPQQVVQPSSLRLVPVNVRFPKGRVGYIAGSGDSVMEDLAQAGLDIEPLADEALRSGELGRFRAIVVGIRAFNTREEVRAARARLMKYVENGGTLVVQYNTQTRWSPLEVDVAPFPLTVGRDRVTDERAQMVPVNAQHPLLHTPNRLGPEDFEGWVQERGLYFAEKWDPQLTPVFRIADPGEPPSEGSLLVGRHGRGRYVYTGLSFFRQLPAGVPGAYRLMANLLEGP